MSQSGQDSLFGPGEHSVSQERGCSGLHREKQTVWWLKAWVLGFKPGCVALGKLCSLPVPVSSSVNVALIMTGVVVRIRR